MHDLWIGNVAAFRFSVKFIGDRLVTYRCHDGNASFTATGKSGNSTLRKIAIRLTTVKIYSFQLTSRRVTSRRGTRYK